MDPPNSAGSFLVEGILVASDPGRVRILLDQVALDIDEDDVLDVSILPPPPLLLEGFAKAVRLELRRPARLLLVAEGSAYENVIWRRGQLFPLRTRRNESPGGAMSEDYLALERAFFERYGIRGASRNEAP